jgi:hypothetical protein
MKIYEQSFDLNEWVIIFNIIFFFMLIWITPKIFSLLEGIIYLLYGVYFGMLSDQTISLKPWDFYDVNDSSAYELFDFFSYIMYGPVSYFFIYLYVRLKIRNYHHITYIFIWVLLSLLIDWIALQIGIFHFDKGYKTYWSIPIYIFVQSVLILLYHFLQKIKYKTK